MKIYIKIPYLSERGETILSVMTLPAIITSVSKERWSGNGPGHCMENLRTLYRDVYINVNRLDFGDEGDIPEDVKRETRRITYNSDTFNREVMSLFGATSPEDLVGTEIVAIFEKFRNAGFWGLEGIMPLNYLERVVLQKEQ